MENKKQFETGTKNPENKERNFNFPEIAKLKEGMTRLVRKLQSNIESGKYDVLISDEVGGRIPTLVLREIIKSINPEAKIDTYFIASGKTYFPEYKSENYDKLILSLKDMIGDKNNNGLLITQYVHSGKTLAKLANILQEAGLPHIDAAVLNSAQQEEYLENHIHSTENIFIGIRDSSTYEFDERTPWLTGVAKAKEYSPRLKLLQEVIAQEGRGKFISEQEWMDIFDIKRGEKFQEVDMKFKDPEKNARWEKRAKEPLSEQELEKLRQTIIKAREDVKTLAEEVLGIVWQSR